MVFAVAGLGAGAVFAALALGLIVTYRGTGVINFAAGVMGLWSGYVYAELRTTGHYVLPVVLVPDRFALGAVSMPVALALSVLTGVLLGLVAHLLVFRPLRDAPALAKVVASAGLTLALQSLIVLRFGTDARTVDPILPSSPVRVGDVGVPRDRLLLAGLVVLLAVAVAAWSRSSRTGLATRAAAENRRFAALAQFSPDVLAAAAWAMSAGVVALVVVLGSPATGLNPVSYTLLIVPALACALVGRLQAIAPAVLAGLLLGVLQSETTFFATKTWWPSWATVGVASALPFLAVIVVLFLVGRSLPTRDAEETAHLPAVRAPRNRPWAVAAALLGGLALILLTNGSYRFGVITTMAVAVLALSFVVLTGLLGQVSFAQAAFAGIAGFALSKLTQGAGLGFPVAPLLAAAGAGLFGLLAGLPALRIRGAQLAVVTLSLALACDQLLFQNPSFNNIRTGNGVTSPRLLGLDLAVRAGSQTARVSFAVLVMLILAAACVAVGNWMRSATGRRMLAVRSNERASASLGVDVTRTKLLGFTASAFLAGIAGTLLAYSRGSVSSESFTTLVGVSFLVFAYLGGIASVTGALVAGTFAPLGIVFVLVNRLVPGATQQGYQLVAAVALVVTAIANPQGIAGGIRDRWDRQRTRAAAGSAVQTAPSRSPGTMHARADLNPDPLAPAELAPADGSPLLELVGLSVRFGGLCALDQVHLQVRAGQIVGLLGANGAGKTTLIDAVSGFVPCEGDVLLGGRSLKRTPAHLRSRAGLARTWQSVELFGDLSVRDNVRVAGETTTLVSALRDLAQPLRGSGAQRAAAALDVVGLEAVADLLPGDLSLGQQKLVNVARCLIAQPRVLLLDEPAAGLSTGESRALAHTLRQVVGWRMGALLVEHDVALVLEVCDHVYVLDFGRVIAHGTPDQVRHDPRVSKAYLGAGPAPELTPTATPTTAASR